ncbi:hypothetical protein F4678DRAFT_446324 [Xylaria arbuscula]|nr:hypothetical protein F4678DRAFT_446324 [Xylaria arbuscula]
MGPPEGFLTNVRLIRNRPGPDALEKINTFFHRKLWTDSRDKPGRANHLKFTLKYMDAWLNIDDQWRICFPHPFFNVPNPMVCAHFFQVEFTRGCPEIEKWGDIAKELREKVLSDCDMKDAALEFTCKRDNGVISAFYPPEVTKDELRSMFAGE